MQPATKSAITPEFVVAFRELILSTLAAEMQTTKKVVGAIPEAGKSYRPDPKSRTAAELAWHIIYNEVHFLEEIAKLNIVPSTTPEPPPTIADMLKWYQENFPKAVKKVRDMNAAQLLTPVDFYGVFKYPVFQYLMLVNNHSIHHRGQLATYLRPMGSMVPSIYGGSADEPFKP
jgi:uncharacterized damage-inducible protein DinB